MLSSPFGSAEDQIFNCLSLKTGFISEAKMIFLRSDSLHPDFTA